MEEELKQRFKKYIYPKKLLTILFAILSIGALAFWFYSLLDVRSHPGLYEKCIFAFVAVLICGVVTGCGIYSQWKVTKKIKEIEQRGELPLVLHDFEMAETAFNDALRMGQTYMLGKGTGGIFTYNDIVQIYQYIHKTNGLEDSRMIKVKTSDGKTHDLCKLPLRGKGDDELSQVFAYVKGKNEKIYLGYN